MPAGTFLLVFFAMDCFQTFCFYFGALLTCNCSSFWINQSEFTDLAWEEIVGSVDAARQSKKQVVEIEHLMKALLEQKNGLARRIFTKVGFDNTYVLQATEQFISQYPKVCHMKNLDVT